MPDVNEKNQRRHTNDGFTLVELLIAVLILGVVVAPLLHTMITAMNTASKGRKAQNATLLSQTLSETVNAASLNELLTDPENTFLSLAADSISLYDATLNVTDTPDPSQFSIGLDSIPTADGTSAYDALISFTADAYPQNNEEVSIYTSMDSVYTQPVGAAENPDVAAAEYFADMAFEAVLSQDTPGREYGATPSASDFFFHREGAEMNRTILIIQDDRSDEEDGETGNINGHVVFSYTAKCTVSYTSETEGPGSTPISCGDYDVPAMEFTLGDDQSTVAPKAFYFFFYPNFGGTDLIDFVRCDTLPLRVFLVRQSPPLYFWTDTEPNKTEWANRIAAALPGYRPKVRLREPFSAGANLVPVADLYLNFTTVAGGSKYDFITMHGAITIDHSAVTGISVYRGLSEAHGSLVVQSAEDRLYQVDVRLYPAGSGFSEQKRVMTLTSTVVK